MTVRGSPTRREGERLRRRGDPAGIDDDCGVDEAHCQGEDGEGPGYAREDHAKAESISVRRAGHPTKVGSDARR
jgi:hypothetical protein